MLIDLENQTSLPFELEILEKIAASLTAKHIELIITDNNTIQSLNQIHRGKDAPTDVLSFPLEDAFSGMPLGSIVISEEFVKNKSKLYGHTIQDELNLLFIHGLLHLLGFDHECDRGEMRAKEKELIEVFGLPTSLIVRTDAQEAE
ncbi:MAG TPA: rRNA maturation RNase YbeY [Sulfurovum sp. UBA12169]|nr:MAG TPA: rRNA maturation RNase YbeY [Sulfurovum sp. UBA12169]